MVIRAFGWVGIVVGAVALLLALLGLLLSLSPAIQSIASFPLAMTAILNGALLIGFAELIAGMETLNTQVGRLSSQVEPLSRIGQALAARYSGAAAQVTAEAPAAAAAPPPAPEPRAPDLDEVIANPPPAAQVYANGNLRVVLLPDGRVVAQTAEGTRDFPTLDAYKTYAGLA